MRAALECDARLHDGTRGRLARNGRGQEAQLAYKGSRLDGESQRLAGAYASDEAGYLGAEGWTTALNLRPGSPIVGGDKRFDTAGFVAALRSHRITCPTETRPLAQPSTALRHQ